MPLFMFLYPLLANNLKPRAPAMDSSINLIRLDAKREVVNPSSQLQDFVVEIMKRSTPEQSMHK